MTKLKKFLEQHFEKFFEHVGCLIILFIIIIAFICWVIEPLILTLAWNHILPFIWADIPKLPFWLAIIICTVVSMIIGMVKKDR